MASPMLETRTAPHKFWNVPNTLTVGRLVLGLAVCGLISAGMFVAALAVFIVAAMSDALDGYLARKLAQETPIGRQLDPLVDKLIVGAALIHLLPREGSGLMPWMVTTILVRELIVQALRSLIEGRGEAFGARMLGKLKTVFQCLAIGGSLVGLAMTSAPLYLTLTRDILIYSAVALTVISGCGYLAIAWPKLKAGRAD
jgi:CDP-diacylglycerol---glycerol-3-phosphate 3-phosphatidyltransferase